LINDYTGLSLKKNIEQCCLLSNDSLLNTDGEKGFNTLGTEIQVKNEKISYEEKNHRLLWLNIIIGNIKNNITGIYHGITKREMPLFLNEQEYRFNHRNMGKTVMDKIKKYLQKSFPISHRLIVYILNISAPHFS
ncbi:transposase, partial [Catenibacterium mitsuokai]|uniref:transposase n=2 Tax=Catenibacterium mitsuokai TaxID=100886 RepID=UPI003F88C7DC